MCEVRVANMVAVSRPKSSHELSGGSAAIVVNLKSNEVLSLNDKMSTSS